MQTLISELARLYLPDGADEHAALVQQGANAPVQLTDTAGRIRAMVVPFEKEANVGHAAHWDRLCTIANALQSEFDFPAPAVSISGASGYRLWMSLATPVPVAKALAFVDLLHQAYLPELGLRANSMLESVALPPCLNQDSGKWAAFIHPGLGESFADEAGLEMAPSLAGQLAFLAGLQSIDAEQFENGLALLRPEGPAPAPVESPETGTTSAETLLLKDATLEDIVKFLHARNIEPTFRHLVPHSRAGDSSKSRASD